ncbi:type III-A CRISPR-associated RAMP protein Csm3 [Methanobrevibacter millerae]|uniref:CRISPR system Cms endoribonuclease Csm3 n=1 Tax=Methanobrevibacter millerae TaxID=230361 RepID=A0A0U3E4L2_9EURY|nr:type III-A CRISPR-associated RAMP protein Csm3 [Methanobrevibacter millerae]ALT68967.1 CRISPR-associated RAMP protein Csm3 family [Methanobrevibacter millerae]
MFRKNIIIKGIITCETGLHIGDSSDTVEIGGSDSPIVRDSITGFPYIPGSSIKGKLRSLFELSDPESCQSIINNAKEDNDVIVSTCIDCDAVKLFGTTPENIKDESSRINFKTRLLVRDAHPTDDTIEMWKDNDQLLKGVELKWENTINRITSKAVPRNIERVPKGSEFNFEIIISVYDEDEDVNRIIKKLLLSMYLLQNDYLGGSGSRGSGQISFNHIYITERDRSFYLTGEEKDPLFKDVSFETLNIDLLL